MTSKVTSIVHANQQAIYQTALEAAREQWPHLVETLPVEQINQRWELLIGILTDYWEKGTGEKAESWAATGAARSLNLGVPVNEVLDGLEILPKAIRPHLDRELTDRGELLGALAALDDGVALLRRSYMQALFGKQQQRLARLHELTVIIGSERDNTRVLQRIVAAAIELVGARYAALAVYDEDRIVQFVHQGIDPDQLQQMGDPPVGRGLLGLLAKERRTIRMADLTKHAQHTGFPPNHPQMKSFLGVPIFVRNRLRARLYLADKEGADEFSQQDQQLLEMLTAHGAVAIENARLYQESQEWAGDQAVLNHVLQVATSTLNRQTLLERVTRTAAEAMGTNRSVIILGSSEQEELVIAGGFDGRFPDQVLTGMTVTRSTMPDLWLALETQKPQLNRQMAANIADEELRTALEELNLTSSLHVPIIVQDKAVGVLALAESRAAHRFTDRHIRLAQAIADQISLAIVNSQLYEDVQRSAISRRLVGEMLRDFQSVGGLSPGSMFLAGEELARRVGADSIPVFLSAFASMGLGALVLSHANEARRRWHFRGKDLVESTATDDQPTGNYTRGFLCGAVSSINGGARVAGVEVRCQSMRDEFCEFVVQVID